MQATSSSSPSISGINLEDPATFMRKTLTPDQANDRLGILEKAQETLQAQSQNLTPRSLREKQELEGVFGADESTLGQERVTRKEPAQYYTIQFSSQWISPPALTLISPQQRLIEKFNRANTRITALNTYVSDGSQTGILNAVVNPGQEMTWYQEAYNLQTEAIFKTDFLDALRYSYAANLNLLSAAALLSREVGVYRELLDLHGMSTSTYEDQVFLNRNCEMTILENARKTQRSLLELRDLLIDCGPRLSVESADFLERCNGIVEAEEKRTIALCKSINTANTEFLAKLESLKSGIDKCLKKIDTTQSEITLIIKKFEAVLKEKEELSVRKTEIQSKYEDFQKAKEKEHTSRKVEVKHHKVWVFEWSTSNVVEADFGSSNLYLNYLKITQDSEAIENKLRTLETELEGKIQQHGTACNQNDLNQAAGSLAAALSAVKQLENAVQIKKQKTETQINQIQARLTNKELAIQTIPQAVNFLGDLNDKILGAHTLWVQSHKQVGAIQVIRSEEQGLMLCLTQALQEGTEAGVVAIRAALAPFKGIQGGNNPLISRMPSEIQLLEDINSNPNH